jgi:hypothetical protein
MKSPISIITYPRGWYTCSLNKKDCTRKWKLVLTFDLIYCSASKRRDIRIHSGYYANKDAINCVWCTWLLFAIDIDRNAHLMTHIGRIKHPLNWCEKCHFRVCCDCSNNSCQAQNKLLKRRSMKDYDVVFGFPWVCVVILLTLNTCTLYTVLWTEQHPDLWYCSTWWIVVMILYFSFIVFLNFT